jgi:hypothetical protein
MLRAMTQPPPPYPPHPAYPGGQPYPSYPGGSYPGAPFPPAVPPPPPAGRWQPARVEPLPGTDFSLVQLRVEPIVSGLAIGSLVAGVGSILVSLLVFCFGLTGSSEGWGGWVSGAFTVLSVVVGAGAIGVGLGARRQIRRSGHTGQVRFTGGGLAIAGISCGAAGAGIALAGLVLTLVLQLAT